MSAIKFVCLLFLVGILSSSLKAQHISLGPSVGAGISTVSNSSDVVDVNPQFLWNAGVIFIYSTKTHFGFGADLKYSSEGYGWEFATPGDSLNLPNTDVRLNYLRLPVKVLYFFGEYGDNIRPKIFLGLTPGLLLSAETNNDVTGTIDVKDELNSFDLGVHAGAGLNFKLASAVWLNADLTIYQGFLDINNEGENTALNRNIAVNVGVAFGIGGEKQASR